MQDDWTKAPAPPSVPVEAMDDLTVFAVAQLPLARATDTKALDRLLQVAPDLVLRGWGQWSIHGNDRSGYDGAFLSVLHLHDPPIRFLGGGTASAIFSEQFSDQSDLKTFASRGLGGELVEHADLNAGEFRGSLANPKFRAYLAQISGYQIEQGVDGLVFTELNADMLGRQVGASLYDGNEGYDDFHVADFTAFLLARYRDADLAHLGLPSDNHLLQGISPLLLAPRSDPHNFNYRTYRQGMGSAFVADWGAAEVDITPPGATSFAQTPRRTTIGPP